MGRKSMLAFELSLAMAKEMKNRGILSGQEFVEYARKLAAKYDLIPCISPRCNRV